MANITKLITVLSILLQNYLFSARFFEKFPIALDHIIHNIQVLVHDCKNPHVEYGMHTEMEKCYQFLMTDNERASNRIYRNK